MYDFIYVFSYDLLLVFLIFYFIHFFRGKNVVSDDEIIACPPEKKNIRSDVRTAGTYGTYSY